MIHQRKKVWPWIFGIGIGVNLIALGFFIFNELHHRPMPDGKQLKEVIANELQFDHQQRAVFTQFVKNHQHQSATIREEIAKAKMPDLTAANLEAAVRTIAGSARSMGITVEGL